MSRKLLTIMIVVNILATIAAVAWSLLWLHVAGLVLYDTNLEAFMHALTPEQGQGITHMAKSILRWAIVPLVVTNRLWLLVRFLRGCSADPGQQRC